MALIAGRELSDGRSNATKVLEFDYLHPLGIIFHISGCYYTRASVPNPASVFLHELFKIGLTRTSFLDLKDTPERNNNQTEEFAPELEKCTSILLESKGYFIRNGI